ncbi:MAG: pyridoxamine kinase [Ruminococcaceae bacterium]|nr:pyridoxamine kinase [Oscillospiraceae bacterium]
MSYKRIAAIHDISCFGRCSLTVALPILSAAGIETAVIPTSILSTHTGGFSGYTFRELTDDILPVAEHWRKEGITVPAVYTGYLGSKEQVDLVISAIDTITEKNALIVVDPAMADYGRLYGGFPEDFPKYMSKLCKRADIIVPNITEACMLLDKDYSDGPYSEDFINELLLGLYNLTKAKVVLSGVWFDFKRIGAACFDGENAEYIFSDRIDASYHGTGDVFASALVSGLMNGKDIKTSAELAVNFTCKCIKTTQKMQPNDNYGVCFEAEIPTLLKMLELV